MSKQIDHQDNQEEVKKVVTRYERRLEKKKKEEQKVLREKRIAQIVGVALLAVLLGMLVSFPIRSYTQLHKTIATIDGEKVSRIEFDYNYYSVMNNYISQYGSILSYMGLDVTQDLSAQMYSDTMTWKDYFDQMAVESIKQNKALMKDSAAKGFTYDTADDYKVLQNSMKEQAKTESMTEKEFIQTMYGPLATVGRLEPYLKETLFLAAYYEELDEELTPSDEAIQAYYEAHKDEYDSVDYRFTEVSAIMPTGPAGEETSAADSTAENVVDATEEVYQPTDEEIAAAMAVAKEEAEEVLTNISKDGTLRENEKQSSMVSAIREWMLDSVRQEGDTNVIEDADYHKYYVVEFIKRYLDETRLADIRVIAVDPGMGQDVLDEWKAGDATEESFIALYHEYNNEDTGLQDNDGLFSELSQDNMQEDMAAWVFEEGRTAGDATMILVDAEEPVEYVIYYVGLGSPTWMAVIRTTMLQESVTTYVNDLTAAITVEDPEGNLPYLKAEAAASLAAEETAATESAETTDDTQTATTETAQ
jgi:hypothetical protein